jgi:RNA polymerase sigma-70 factor (ECF subfamily)
MKTTNDQFYIEKVLKGDANAFAFLVDSYQKMIFTLAFKMTKNREEAEEICQDAFLKAYQNLNKFQGDSKFSTW